MQEMSPLGARARGRCVHARVRREPPVESPLVRARTFASEAVSEQRLTGSRSGS